MSKEKSKSFTGKLAKQRGKQHVAAKAEHASGVHSELQNALVGGLQKAVDNYDLVVLEGVARRIALNLIADSSVLLKERTVSVFVRPADWGYPPDPDVVTLQVKDAFEKSRLIVDGQDIEAKVMAALRQLGLELVPLRTQSDEGKILIARRSLRHLVDKVEQMRSRQLSTDQLRVQLRSNEAVFEQNNSDVFTIQPSKQR